MRILHLGKFYSPIEGGIESINRFVVEALKGNEQRIISFNNKTITVEDDIDNIPVVRTSSRGIVASQPLSWRYWKELQRYVKIFHPDVIYFHYPNPLVALYLILTGKGNSHLVVHWHSDVVAQKFLHRFIKPVENKLAKMADVLITTSPTYRNGSEILQKFANKVRVIPCSIDEARFEKSKDDEAKIKKLKDQFDNKQIVFFIGRHVEYKGIRYLLEAEREVTADCVFVIAGQGPLTEVLKTEFTSPRIHWVGRLSDDEMRQYYYAADVFAFPSITRNEAFGVVLAEAMYCGCPPVTFTIDGSGVNWVSISGKTGLEVPNKDVKSYSEAITNILLNRPLHNQLADEGKKRVKQFFTKEVVSVQYAELLSSIN